MFFADLFDMGKGYGGEKKFWVSGGRDLRDGERCTLFSREGETD